MYPLIANLKAAFARRFSPKVAANNVLDALALAQGKTSEALVAEIAAAAAATAAERDSKLTCAQNVRANTANDQAQAVATAQQHYERIVAEAEAALQAVVIESQRVTAEAEDIARKRETEAAALNAKVAQINLAMGKIA